MGKKTPLTLAHFEEFFRLLPSRADSERSWTLDLKARRQRAAEEAGKLRRQAEVKEQEAAGLRERLASLKRGKPWDAGKIAEVEQQIADIMKEVHELKGRADDVENAVYDLKAVNPNRRNDQDTSRPEELIAFIRAKGREVEDALKALATFSAGGGGGGN